MDVQVRRVEYKDVEEMRQLYRSEANCQIVANSALVRRLADPYLVLVGGRVAGYGAVWNKYNVGRASEFYTLPAMRGASLPMFRELLAVSQATQIAAQTNLPLMVTLLFDCAENIEEESILFHDAAVSNLTSPDGMFRRATKGDSKAIFTHRDEPVGDWVVEAGGAIVATGGYLCHYNPPYGDVYMEVAEPARRRGYGSYLVQELKRVCYEAGKRPSARCNPTNHASRATLQRAGFLPCARLLVGDVRRPSA